MRPYTAATGDGMRQRRNRCLRGRDRACEPCTARDGDTFCSQTWLLLGRGGQLMLKLGLVAVELDIHHGYLLVEHMEAVGVDLNDVGIEFQVVLIKITCQSLESLAVD